MSTSSDLRAIRNDLVIAALALLSVALLLLDTFAELAPHQQMLIERVDLLIAAIFLAEFLWRLARAENRMTFFARSWWELLAAIPLTADVTRALRGVRLLRLVHAIRLLRVIRLGVRLTIIMARIRLFGRDTHLLSITLTVVTIVLAAATGFHYFEYGVNRNVTSFFDSVWWSVVTVTSVGYGDIYPVTTEGRIIAIALLVVGLATFGVFAGSIASWITRRQQEESS